MTTRRATQGVFAVGAIVAAALVVAAARGGSPPTGADRIDPSIHKIDHVVVIMQENRSFDSYFGTYPGADGIPMRGGVPTVCLPDPARRTCVRPTTIQPISISAGRTDRPTRQQTWPAAR